MWIKGKVAYTDPDNSGQPCKALCYFFTNVSGDFSM